MIESKQISYWGHGSAMGRGNAVRKWYWEKQKSLLGIAALQKLWYDEPRVWEFPLDGCLDAYKQSTWSFTCIYTFIHLCVAFSSKAVINLFISYNSVMALLLWIWWSALKTRYSTVVLFSMHCPKPVIVHTNHTDNLCTRNSIVMLCSIHRN